MALTGTDNLAMETITESLPYSGESNFFGDNYWLNMPPPLQTDGSVRDRRSFGTTEGRDPAGERRSGGGGHGGGPDRQNQGLQGGGLSRVRCQGGLPQRAGL